MTPKHRDMRCMAFRKSRHVEKMPTGTIDLHLRKQNHPSEPLVYFDSLIAIVIDASVRIHECSQPATADLASVGWGDHLTKFREAAATVTDP